MSLNELKVHQDFIYLGGELISCFPLSQLPPPQIKSRLDKDFLTTVGVATRKGCGFLGVVSCFFYHNIEILESLSLIVYLSAVYNIKYINVHGHLVHTYAPVLAP